MNQNTHSAKAARTVWVYRNFDLIAALMVAVKFFAIGLAYSNRLAGGFETNLWFWIPAFLPLVPIVATLGIVKSHLRRALLFYELNGQLRVFDSGLIEAGTYDLRPEQMLVVRLSSWSGLLNVSFWVLAAFYVGARIVFWNQFAFVAPLISVVDGFMAITLGTSIALARRANRRLIA